MDAPRLRVLLVDDDEDDYVVTRDLLGDIPSTTYHLDWVQTYAAGLAAIEQRAHDVYLLDYQLGGRTGLDLLREAHARGCQAPLILLTGLGDHSIDLEAMKAGASDYLVKGHIEPALLERALRYAVERTQMVQALQHRTQEVEQEKGRLAAVVRGAADAILVFDDLGRTELLNQAGQGLFIRGQAMVGAPLPARRGYDPLIALCQQARQSQGAVQGEVTWPDKRAFSVLVTPIEGGGLVAVLHDVTHFKDLERLKNDFIATTSHDLKNPLTAIMGYSELLARAGPLNELQGDFVERMQRAARQMHDLVFNLLELARVDRGVELNLEVCDLHELLNASVEEFRPQAEGRQQGLALRPPPPFTYAMIDVRRMRQVLYNLIGNAIKYTSPGGQITISAEVTGQVVQIRVRDTGLGIPPADQPFVFDKFYRVQNNSTRDIEGSGLGLSIVKTIVEQHGGRVWVRSSGLSGEGTEFGFNLVLTPRPAEPPAGA